MKEPQVWFRWNSKNSYSIAALLPLVEAMLTREPKFGIMLYSFATAQAEEIYAEVDMARDGAIDGHGNRDGDRNRDRVRADASAWSGAGALFIAGGPHPSARPGEALEHFDFVVIGEGEETLPELLAAIKEGEDPGRVQGIAYRAGTEIRFTGSRAPVNLDLYPPFGKILAPIEISRGCPWGCAYCQTPRLFGMAMRHRSIKTIARYAGRHKDIRFTSPNSLAYGSDGRAPRLDKVEALLKALAELKKPIYFGTFPSEVRPEFVSDRAIELITDYCANRTLCIGGQSGSPAVLKAICRGHGRREIEVACEVCLEHDLTPQVDLIFGLPSESEEDQRMTSDLARWITARGGKVRAHCFTPLPGTPLEDALPASLSEAVEAELGRLALEGKLTGSWSAWGELERDLPSCVRSGRNLSATER